MASSPLLCLDGVTRNYSSDTTIGPINLDVHDGEFVSLLGPSGCGKTTMLRCVAGFEPIDSGRLLSNGVDLAPVPAHKRNIGFIFQSYALFPHLTVAENVAFGLRLRKISRKEQRERVSSALDVVDLRSQKNRLPKQLSGGQRQRVAIARAIVLNPTLLLLDEPLSNLDLKLRVQMRRELRDLQRRIGSAFVYVTHDQNEALAMSDKIAVLNKGAIAQFGSPAEVYTRPASRFVADFLGSANINNIQNIEFISDDRVLVNLSDEVSLCVYGDNLPDEEKYKYISIRAESIYLLEQKVHAGSDVSPNCFKAQLVDSTYTGDRFEARVNIINIGSSDFTKSITVRCYLPTDNLPSEFHISIDPKGVVPLKE